MHCRGTVRLARFAMATRFELLLVGEDPVRLRAAGEEALREVDLVEGELSRFRSDSGVRFLERHGARRPVRPGSDVFELLCLCREVHARSRGGFDVTVAPLLDAGEPRGPGTAAPPAVVGFDAVQLDAERQEVRLTCEGLRFDFGAVGKGHALDRAAAVLRDRGVTQAFLHGGTSSSLALGRGPEGDAWRVAVRDPCGGGLLATVTLHGEALSVSGTHGGQRRIAGRRAPHILDPRLRAPVPGARLTAVKAVSAAWADAWSTALLVAGPSLESGDAALYWQEGEPVRVLGRPGVFAFPPTAEAVA